MFKFQLSENLSYKVDTFTFLTEAEKVVLLKSPAIVFVTGNDLVIKLTGENEKIIRNGQLFLLPRDFVCLFRGYEKCRVSMVEVPNITALYLYFLSSKIKLKTSQMEVFYPLDINKHMQGLIESIFLYRKGGLLDNVLAGMKVMELFCILRFSYPEANLSSFFSPIQDHECSFALFILSNYEKVRTAEELAHLSNFSLSGFNKQFHKIFGTSPYKWMLQQKIDKIYKELYFENKPIKLIAEEYGFANLSNLGDFCRKHLGLSPSAIRDRKNIKKNIVF